MFRNDSLAGSWTALVERLDRDAVLDRWAMDEPALHGVHRIADLARLTAAGTDVSRADEVVGSLVRLASAAGGRDDDALLLVVHLLSDMVLPMAAQLADLSPDVLPVIVCELACQIRSIDPRRPVRGWATTLKWLTHDAVLAEFRPTTRNHPELREVPVAVDVDDPVWSRPRVPAAAPIRQPGGSEDIDLIDVLLWAMHDGVARDDVALLAATEAGRATRRRCSDRAVAAAFGVNVRTLYRRNNRTLAALRAAGVDYLAAVA
jgi:hypothetical protein